MSIEEILNQVSNIPSSVYEPEIKMWFKYIKDMKSPVIVDFGTGWGKSAIALALSNPTAKVMTCDIGDIHVRNRAHYADWVVNNHEDYVRVVKNYLKEKGVSDRVDFRLQSSLKTPWQRDIDVLNIDSDHTYEGTKAEILRWIPFVKKNGLIFFHDYEHPNAPGVKQAIDELIPKKFDLELIEVTDAGPVKCACYKK